MSVRECEVAHGHYLEAGFLNSGGLLRSRRHAIFGDRGGGGVRHCLGERTGGMDVDG